MKYKELAQKSEAELKKELASLKEQELNLRLKIKLGHEKKFHLLGQVRKDIARILTFMRAN